MNKSSEGASHVPTGDKEVEKRELDSSTAGPTEPSIVQSGNNQEADPPSQEKESQTQIPPTQSNSESTDNATDIINLAVPEVTGVITSGPLQREQSTHQDTGMESNEPTIELVNPEELQSTDKNSVPDPSLAPVNGEESSEVNLTSSDVSRPEFVATISESPELSTKHQEAERAIEISDIDHSVEIEGLQARLKEVEQRFSGIAPFLDNYWSAKLTVIFRRVQLFPTIACREVGC